MNKAITFPLLLAAIALLVWNEYHRVHVKRLLVEAVDNLVVDIDTSRLDTSLNGKLVYYGAFAHRGEQVHDPLFGYGGPYMRVERKVEYYQWKETKHQSERTDRNGDTHYETRYTYGHAWVDKPINSDDFHGANSEHYKNTVLVSIPPARAYSRGSRMGPYLLSKELIDSMPPVLQGTVTPDTLSDIFRATIDSTTQGGIIPHHTRGDTVYYGDRPWQPMIGDVRVVFTYSRPAFMYAMAQPYGRFLRPFRASDGYWFTISRMNTQQFNPEESLEFEQWGQRMLAWCLRVIGWLMMIGGVKNLFEWLRRPLENIPVLGPLVSFGIGAVAFIVGTLLTLLVVGAALIVFRPWVGLAIFGVIAAIVTVLIIVKRHSQPKPPPIPIPVPPQIPAKKV